MGIMPWPKTDIAHYLAKFRLSVKGCTIKGLVVQSVFDHIIMHIIKQDFILRYSKKKISWCIPFSIGRLRL